MQPSTPRYWLCTSVYVCETAGTAIFLDLKHDKYFALAGDQARALTGLVAGWRMSGPPDQEPSTAPLSTDDAISIAERLREKGLLTSRQASGKSAETVSLDVSQVTHGTEVDFGRRPSIRATDVIRFALACARAGLALRFSSIDAVVARFRYRKHKAQQAARVVDAARVLELVATFRRLRPFAFTAKEQCLFHAVALLDFLLGYGVPATWVIGVETRPWAAHTWVQYDNVVLDGSPELIRFYTPILVT